jgi:hypothetical protein
MILYGTANANRSTSYSEVLDFFQMGTLPNDTQPLDQTQPQFQLPTDLFPDVDLQELPATIDPTTFAQLDFFSDGQLPV